MVDVTSRALLCGLLLMTAYTEATAQIVQKVAVMSTGGGSAATSTFSVTSSIGQALPPGRAEASTFSVSGGFLASAVPEEVDTQGPIIGPVSIPPSEAGRDVHFEVSITDSSDVVEAALHYRRGGAVDFTTVTMTEAGGAFEAIVPGADVTPDGVEFVLTAEDARDNRTRSPSVGVNVLAVTVAGQGIVRDQPQPAGRSETAYRIVSWPLDVADKRASAVLERDLGASDHAQWRFFELLPPSGGSQGVREGPSGVTIEPGVGYWLIVAEQATLSTGAGTSIRTDQPFRLPLHEGWNFVANPFSFPVPFSNLSSESGKNLDFRTFAGGWSSFASAMQPFQGYAVITEDQESDVLLIDPGRTAADKRALTDRASTAAYAWSIGITATTSTARDPDNVAAVAGGAAHDFDLLDRPEPPTIGNFVSLFFPHPDWDKPLHDYAVDVRPEIDDGEVWEFVVESNQTEAVQLQFTNVTNIPASFNVVLVDEVAKLSRDLRDNPAYELTTGVAEARRALKLLVGTDNFVASTVKGLDLIPSSLELSPNFPNPFRDATTIRYGLAEDRIVTITVFDLLGREVCVLKSAVEQKPGYHAVTWDGRDAAGATAASGVYFYVLEAGDRIAVGKMSLVR